MARIVLADGLDRGFHAVGKRARRRDVSKAEIPLCISPRLTDPRIIRLSEFLEIPRYASLGLVLTFWFNVLEFFPDGIIGITLDRSDDLHYQLNYYPENGKHLEEALVYAGFIRRVPLDEGRIVVSDWKRIHSKMFPRSRRRLRWERQLLAGGEIKVATRRMVYERDGYQCVYCQCPDDLTIDHILAISKGGTNDPSNLQTLCRACNSRKGDREEVRL